jgi:uncharacterized damage-inducible protein DinB
MNEIGSLFLSKSRRYLTESYLPKLEAALDTVSEDDVWWRPNEASNSMGNLLLHMSGSLRYWVVSVAGGAPSDRVRQEEFDAAGGVSREELVAGLRDAVHEADRVLAGLSADDLLAPRDGDEYATTVLESVYHAVEHFSMHAGQVLQLVKMRRGADLEFVD